MALWWFASIVFLFVVIPVVVVLLRGVAQPVTEISRHVDDILEHGGSVMTNLDAVPALLRTRDLVKQVGTGVGQYGVALDLIIPDPS